MAALGGVAVSTEMHDEIKVSSYLAVLPFTVTNTNLPAIDHHGAALSVGALLVVRTTKMERWPETHSLNAHLLGSLDTFLQEANSFLPLAVAI